MALIASSAMGEETVEPRVFAALAMTKAQAASSTPTDSGVFLLNEKAQKWERFGPVIQSITSVTADPSNANRVFLACGNGIVRSENGGETWRMTTGWRESDFTKIAIDPENGNNVYAASVWGVHVSADGGDTWSRANKGLAERYCRTIIVDELKPKRLLLGTADGIYQSNDGARSWKAIRSSPKLTILRIARSESNPKLWIAGTEGQGVYISNDDGKSWEASVPALKENNIYGVAADPGSDLNLAVGGWGTGVWVSSDGGKNWHNRSEGLPSPNLTTVVFDTNRSHRLYASTFEEGTVYSDDLGATWKKSGLYGAYVYDLGMVSIAK